MMRHILVLLLGVFLVTGCIENTTPALNLPEADDGVEVTRPENYSWSESDRILGDYIEAWGIPVEADFAPAILVEFEIRAVAAAFVSIFNLSLEAADGRVVEQCHCFYATQGSFTPVAWHISGRTVESHGGGDWRLVLDAKGAADYVARVEVIYADEDAQ